VVAAILEASQSAQDWKVIDGDKAEPALYIHWLCVHSDFRSTGLSCVMIDFAAQLALKNDIKMLRADTNADSPELRSVYEKLGFTAVGEQEEDYRKTIFYQKTLQ